MKKYIFILACLPFIFGSCEEEFLEKTNFNGLNSDNFMETENQAEQAVNSIYDPLTQYGMYNLGFMVLGEVATDNITNDWGDGGFGPDIVSFHKFNWTGTNQYLVYRWNNAFKGIGRANYLLDNINKVKVISTEKKNQFVGEALFMRALYYYNLVSGFGDIPLIISTDLTPAEINNLEKSPEADVWAQIDADLEEAASLLPDSYPAEEVGRATKGAAYGLLSRTRLWTKDFEGAEDAANRVEGYELLSGADYIKMFDSRMENSVESVMEAQLTPSVGTVWNSDRAEGSLLMHMFPRVTWGRYFIPRKSESYDILDAFEVGDMRREASILIAGQDQIYYSTVDRVSVFPDFDIHSDFKVDLQADGAYQTRKFIHYDDFYWAQGGSFFKVSTAINIPIIRYAEVILNKAEALVEQNKLQDAYNALEIIRTRAGLDMVGVSNTDQSSLREQIRKDRRVELIFEGHRWGDLKRWNELSSLTAAGLNYNGQVNWPIPSQEIDINPNLGN